MSTGPKITFRASLPEIQSALKFGSGMCRISLDVPESDLQNAVALIPLRGTVLRITVEIEGAQSVTPTKKAKEPKGEHSQFWQELFKRGVQHDLSIKTVLGVDGLGNPDAVKNALHQEFGVASLSCISPSDFLDWCSEHQLEGLVTMVNLITKGTYGQEDQRS